MVLPQCGQTALSVGMAGSLGSLNRAVLHTAAPRCLSRPRTLRLRKEGAAARTWLAICGAVRYEKGWREPHFSARGRAGPMTEPSLKRPILLSILAALVTITLKATAYHLTGSVGLLSDALESGVNLLAA